MGPGDPGGEDQGRELSAEPEAGVRYRSWLANPGQPCRHCRGTAVFFPAIRQPRSSQAAPCQPAGEAWWTGLPGLTINRPLPGALRPLGSAQVAQLVEHATENRSV